MIGRVALFLELGQSPPGYTASGAMDSALVTVMDAPRAGGSNGTKAVGKPASEAGSSPCKSKVINCCCSRVRLARACVRLPSQASSSITCRLAR